MKNLKPSRKYYYKVGDLKTQTFSDIKYFKSPPQRNDLLEEIKFAVFGDMGTYMPFGHMVSKMIANFHMVNPYDFIFLTGDIAYAGIGHK
jgi:phosphodiesterase/alkaline phosphatase D-like protein